MYLRHVVGMVAPPGKMNDVAQAKTIGKLLHLSRVFLSPLDCAADYQITRLREFPLTDGCCVKKSVHSFPVIHSAHQADKWDIGLKALIPEDRGTVVSRMILLGVDGVGDFP